MTPWRQSRTSGIGKPDSLAKNAFDTRYADLAQSTPYSRLTPRNIGQRYAIVSCIINYLRASAMQATNQGVGSSNLSGRAIKSNS